MEINPKYVDNVREAILAIDDYLRNKNSVVGAAEIVGGILHDKVMDGVFVVSSVSDSGEVMKKQATDIAAALMTEMCWNTKNTKDIWYDNNGTSEKVVSNANS